MPFRDEFFLKDHKPPVAEPAPEKRPAAQRKQYMRQVSKERAKLNRVVNPERRAFVEQVGECMICQCARAVDCHEITRGPYREAALSEPRLWMPVCRDCHIWLGDTSEWTPAKQLAFRLRWDVFETVRAFQRVTSKDVDLAELNQELQRILLT